MMNELRVYVEHLFEGQVLTAEIIDLKEEIYGNLVARYEDFVAGGMSEAEALEATKKTMTSLDGLLSEGAESTFEASVEDGATPEEAVGLKQANGKRRKVVIVAVSLLAVLVVGIALFCQLGMAERESEDAPTAVVTKVGKDYAIGVNAPNYESVQTEAANSLDGLVHVLPLGSWLSSVEDHGNGDVTMTYAVDEHSISESERNASLVLTAITIFCTDQNVNTVTVDINEADDAEDMDTYRFVRGNLEQKFAFPSGHAEGFDDDLYSSVDRWNDTIKAATSETYVNDVINAAEID